MRSLADPLPVDPIPSGRVFDASIAPPGSKSLTNRVLLISALAEGDSVLRGALTDADDARVMLRALGQLGVGVEVRGADVRIRGAGGRLRGNTELRLGNAGTATRFLTAAAALAEGPVLIDGDPRMRERPIGELVAFLRAIGVGVEELGEPGFPPIRVLGVGAAEGGAVEIPRTLSSQYVSALVMLAPHTRDGITLRFKGEITSRAYVEMTIELMSRTVGVGIEGSLDDGELRVLPAERASGFEYTVEPDASGATYFFAAAAMTPGARVAVPVSARTSLQSDAHFARLLERLGATVEETGRQTSVTGGERLRGGDFDLSEMPDAAMTLAAVACFADGQTVLRGLRTLRVKETDRLQAMVNELSKIGAGVRIVADGEDEALVIDPPSAPEAGDRVVFETYDDHRMAMSLALVGLRRPGVSIADPGCVAKTYPGYWDDLSALRRSIRPASD